MVRNDPSEDCTKGGWVRENPTVDLILAVLMLSADSSLRVLRVCSITMPKLVVHTHTTSDDIAFTHTSTQQQQGAHVSTARTRTESDRCMQACIAVREGGREGGMEGGKELGKERQGYERTKEQDAFTASSSA